MLSGKNLLSYTNLHTPNGYEKNGIYKYFKDKCVKFRFKIWTKQEVIF